MFTSKERAMTPIRNLFLRFVSLLFVILIAQSPALAQQENGIAVTATALTLNGRTTFQYRLTNTGTQRVVALIVGNDYRYGVSELTQYPDGWSFNGGIVAGSVLSPSAWSPLVVATEESSAIELEWRNDGSGDVLPGQSLAGFAVVVAGASTQYLFAHWTAILANGGVAYGLLTQSGPPRISLSLSSLTQTSPGRFMARLEIRNRGASVAHDVLINQITARSLVGTGTVTVSDTSLPITIGTLAASHRAIVEIPLALPVSVKRISLTQQGQLKDSTGKNLSFSGAVSAYTKQ
jgi:hypothetical protein